MTYAELQAVRDERRFTEHDCHYLARALTRLDPSLRLAAFCEEGNPSAPDIHAFAVLPDGRLLDFYGAQTKAEARARWKIEKGSGLEIREVAWEDLREFGDPESSYTPRRARVLARHLVESLSEEEKP